MDITRTGAMERKRSYLAFTIKMLELVNMWSGKSGFMSLVREYYAMIIIVGSTLAIMTDFFLQFYDEHAHFTTIIESLIGGSALLSVIYVSMCFLLKKQEIKRLIHDLKEFEEYLPQEGIDEAEVLHEIVHIIRNYRKRII
ncbi:hypothetical protein JTB14_002059 [Gonioctena quinquepunctata]|nr:hypothetical protein JTB14_002059 [Gonioctena quinquepunctata]